MTVLVTGALGFLGTHVVRSLRAAGLEVLASDLAIHGEPGYVRADVTRHEEIAPLFARWRIEHVVHLAAEVGRENGELFPGRCIDVNVRGTLLLARLCADHGARLYFASSSEIYGDRGREELTEDLGGARLARPSSVYGLTKLHAEDYLRHLARHYGLTVATMRIFTAYGPGERPNPFRSAMTNFIHRLRHGEAVDVHRGTERPWCYVDDVAAAVRGLILDWRRDGEEVFNIGRAGLVPTEDLARQLCTALDRPDSLIRLVDRGRFVNAVKNGSFAKAEAQFGFRAQVDLGEGIARTISWHEATIP